MKEKRILSKIKAYTVETTGLFFWLNNLESGEYARKIGKILHKDAITEAEAREKLGEKLLRLLESNGILRPFLIIVLKDGSVEIHKDSAIEVIEDEEVI